MSTHSGSGHIETMLDGNGILLATIDMQGRSMNVFSLDMMDALEDLIDHVAREDAVKGVVLTSGKPTFLVGADLGMIRMFTERALHDGDADLRALCGRLGRLFRRLETSAKPYVAAINGLALGGGLELALACHRRIVADLPGAMLGLPEVKLGLLPGAGGTQRLPRLIKASAAMSMLLRGGPVSPDQALQLGLVHGVAKAPELIEAACGLAVSLVCSPAVAVAPWDRDYFSPDAAPFDFGGSRARDEVAAVVGISPAERAEYPACDAILDCVIGGWAMPIDDAFEWEMTCFMALIRNRVAGNMVRTLFLERQRGAKQNLPDPALTALRIALAGAGLQAPAGLLRKNRAPLIDASAADTDTLVVASADAADTVDAGRATIVWLTEEDDGLPTRGARAALRLFSATAQGQAAELNLPAAGRDGGDGASDAVAAGRKLAHWLKATLLVTHGDVPLLGRLRQAQLAAQAGGFDGDDILLSVALAAARAWAEGGIADPAQADVAAVLAGLHPAWSGGPYTWLRQTGRAAIAARLAAIATSTAANPVAGEDTHTRYVPATLLALPEGIEALFETADAAIAEDVA